jgi:drug/metabolite transporter (DMT)-like permease
MAVIGTLVLAFMLKTPIPTSLREVWTLIGTGFITGGHWIFFFLSAKVSKISVCLAGVATTAIFCAFLEPILLGTRFRKGDLLLALLGGVGLYVIFHFEFDHFWGLVYALIAAFLSALFGTLNGLHIRKHSPVTITFYELAAACVFACLAWVAYNFFSETPIIAQIPTLSDFGYLAILSLVCTVYAFYAATTLLKKLSPFVINLYVNLEPVYGIILALIIFKEKEQMTSGFYAGTALILASVVFYPVFEKARSNKIKNDTIKK